MDLAELVAREAIHDTLVRYHHFGDSGRFDEMVELFVVDGTLEVVGRPPCVGRDAMRAFLSGAASDLHAATKAPLIRHHLTNVLIELDGPDAASASSYFFVVTERGPDHWGRYRDRLVDDGERWRFVHRRVRTDGAAAGSWAATLGV